MCVIACAVEVPIPGRFNAANALSGTTLESVDPGAIQSRVLGADCILLIVAALDDLRLADLTVLALELDSHYRPCSLAGQVPRLRKLYA